MSRGRLLVLVLVTGMTRVDAGSLVELQVSESGGIYHVSMVMLVHAPAEHVRSVLTDYVHIYRLNPGITESEILPSPREGVVRVRTLLEGCVGVFCKRINRVEDVREQPSGDLEARVVPERSDLRSGVVKWEIRDAGANTWVSYQGHMEPDFFIPPLIGSYFVKKHIRKEVLTSFNRLECIAQVQARRDGRAGLQLASLDSVPGCTGRCAATVGNCPP